MTYEYKPSKQNIRVLNFFGIVSIILGVIAFTLRAL